MSIILRLTNVDIYQNNNAVLTNVNFKLSKGEFVYLVGPTGSGKSSLMRTIYADLSLKQGSAMVVGYHLNDIKDAEIPYLRRKLGIVFQDFQLLTDRSIEDNLLFVLLATGWKDKKKMEQRVLEVLDKVGMRFKLKKFPHELSGGEQQRIVIARALLNNPAVILADEPTGNLDPVIAIEILSLLESIVESGTSVLMATHDHKLIEQFPHRIMKCENGRLLDNLQIVSDSSIELFGNKN